MGTIRMTRYSVYYNIECIVGMMNIIYKLICAIISCLSLSQKWKRVCEWLVSYIAYIMYIGFLGHSSLRLSGESIRSVRVRSLQRFTRNLHVSRNKQLMLYLKKIKNAQIQQQSGMLMCVCVCVCVGVYKLRPKMQ